MRSELAEGKWGFVPFYPLKTNKIKPKPLVTALVTARGPRRVSIGSGEQGREVGVWRDVPKQGWHREVPKGRQPLGKHSLVGLELLWLLFPVIFSVNDGLWG